MTSVSIFQIEKYWPWLYNISLLLLNGYLEIYQIILSLSVKTKIISEIPLAILFANYLKKRRSWELFKDFYGTLEPMGVRSPGWKNRRNPEELRGGLWSPIPHRPHDEWLPQPRSRCSKFPENLTPSVSKQPTILHHHTLQKTVHGRKFPIRKMECC